MRNFQRLNSLTIERLAARRVHLRTLLLASAGAALFGGQAAQAQTADTAPVNAAQMSTTIDEVVVTAPKRSVDLRTIPQSISVMDDRQLDRVNSDSLETFAPYIPGLEMQTFSPGRTRITVRGVSPDEQTGVTTVSYYMDEIPLTARDQRSQTEVRLFDIDHVEILRGPQGTLYGEGAMGGTVRIITNAPDTDDFRAALRVGAYSIQDGDVGYRLNGMLNLPLVTGKLALRIVAESREDAGWIDQATLSIPTPGAAPGSGRYVVDSTESDANSSENTSVRASLLFTPNEALSVNLTYVRDELDVHNANIGTIDALHNQDLALRPSSSTSDLRNLTATYRFDGFSITSASSYTKRFTDQSVTQEPLLLYGIFGGFTPFFSRYDVYQSSRTTNFTQELRAVSDGEGPFRWTVGGYYRKSVGRDFTDVSAFAPPFAPLVAPPGLTIPLSTGTDTTNFHSEAVFGEVEYDFTDKLTLVAGLRWFQEKERLNGTSERASDGVTPRITLRYRPSDNLMTYVTYAEGFRSGGFNPFYPAQDQYDPDTTRNFEIGGKFLSTDRLFSLSGAIYHIAWNNMQFVQMAPDLIHTYIGNANEASSSGVELESEYHFSDNWSVQLAGNYTDAKLESDVLGNLTGVIPAGTPLPAVPKYKLSAILSYQRPADIVGLPDGLLSVTAAVSATGAQYSKLEHNGAYTDPLYGNSYVIGSRIGASSSGDVRAELSSGKWTAAVYVTNVWNTDTPLGNDNFLPVLGQELYWMRPRTIGLSFDVKY